MLTGGLACPTHSVDIALDGFASQVRRTSNTIVDIEKALHRRTCCVVAVLLVISPRTGSI